MLNPTATGMLILVMHLPWERITFHQGDAHFHHLAACSLTDRHLSAVEVNSATWRAPSPPSSLCVPEIVPFTLDTLKKNILRVLRVDIISSQLYLQL